MSAVLVLAEVSAALVLAGGVLSALATPGRKPPVFYVSDAVNHAAVLGVLAALVVVHRTLRSVLRAIRAANEAAGLPDPGEPAATDREAA